MGHFSDSEFFAGKKNFSAKCRNFGRDNDQLLTVNPNILFLIKSLNVWNWEIVFKTRKTDKTRTYLSMITWFEKVSACSIAASKDCRSLTSRTALESSPLLALTIQGYLIWAVGIGSPVTRERIIDIETFAVLIRILCRLYRENTRKRCHIMTVDPRVSGRRKNVGVIPQLIMGSS